MYGWMHLDVFCLQYCKRKEREISEKKFILNKKSLDLFDQFVSMAEREIDYDTVCSICNVFCVFLLV